jgi:hypothetical protein
MTDAEWRTTDDLRAMLSHVRSGANLTRSKPGRRKMRLFACGCCRLIGDLLPDARTRKALELCEKYADGEADDGQLQAAMLEANKTAAKEYAQAEVKALAPGLEAARAVWSACDKDGRQAVEFALEYSVKAVQAARRKIAGKGQKGKEADVAADEQRRRHCKLLRDLFGNPFQLVKFLPGWKAANVVAVGKGIYKDRAFERMPILADALEEAGCSDAAVLEHCRGAGPHWRGCWVIDGVIGKETP